MLRVCDKGHLTGFRDCPMCGTKSERNYPKPPRGAEPTVSNTRQHKRQVAFRMALEVVNKNNPRMARSERRKLARAYSFGVRHSVAA